MTRHIDAYSLTITVRAALVLIALLPLAGCGGGTFAQDPFADAAAECGSDRDRWRPGCATQRNIAALADNPADLRTPQSEAPRDSMRRDALISGYVRSSSNAEPRAPTQPTPASAGEKQP